MTQPSMIVGAGLAGLLAAYAWPNIPIVEALEAREEHKALLRFRSDAVSRLTGIPFRKVTVRKGIYHRENFHAPTIALANAYSVKILGERAPDRSIWNIDPVERYIAPESLYEQLVEFAGDRIAWGTTADFASGEQQPIISTAPLPVVLDAVKPIAPLDCDNNVMFKRASIEVSRFRIPKCDVFQTVYFPDPELAIYRASITGDLLIIEAKRYSPPTPADIEAERKAINEAFYLHSDQLYFVDAVEQRYGKIVDLDPELRKAILFRLTHDHGIYSLGRFATWRNVLLDDLIQDISVIKRLLNSGLKYDLHRAVAR